MDIAAIETLTPDPFAKPITIKTRPWCFDFRAEVSVGRVTPHLLGPEQGKQHAQADEAEWVSVAHAMTIRALLVSPQTKSRIRIEAVKWRRSTMSAKVAERHLSTVISMEGRALWTAVLVNAYSL